MKELDTAADLKRLYTERLVDAKEQYEIIVGQEIAESEARGREGYNFYGSDLEADNTSGIPSGYFSRNSFHSFYNLGGYTAKRLKQESEEFRKNPANKGRFILCLDPFGQGRPGAEFADETIATTLIKSPFKQPASVKEFNGDALSTDISTRVFDHLSGRIKAGGALRTTFFRPVEGLAKFGNNLYVQHRLYENLRHIYDLTDEGGLIFINASGGGFNLRLLRDVLESFGIAGIATEDAAGLPRILIHKDTSRAEKLPSFEEIMSHDPAIVKILMRVAQ